MPQVTMVYNGRPVTVNCGGKGGTPGPCPTGGHDHVHEMAGKFVATHGNGFTPLEAGHHVDSAAIKDLARYGHSSPVDIKHLLSKINEHLAGRGLTLEKKTGPAIVKSSRGGARMGKASGYKVVKLPSQG